MKKESKPKVDREAEKAREEELRRQRMEEERLIAEKNRLARQASRRGSGLESFIKTSDTGILRNVLGA